jgi:hypothetical protein
VVSSVSLEVADGELFLLLGSSGSGKSTLLRMIAGLSEVDAGRVMLRGRDVTDLPPAARGVGFVFQSYALFRGFPRREQAPERRGALTEPRPVRWLLTGAALAFLGFFLFIPLALVFAKAWRTASGPTWRPSASRWPSPRSA